MPDETQARLIAGRFRDLQGLRQVAFGIVLLPLLALEVVFPLSSERVDAASIGTLLWLIGAIVVFFALALVAFHWVSGWYRRQYGLVEQTPHQRRMGRVIGGVGALVFLLPFEIEILTGEHGLPVNLFDFALAFWIIGYWWYLGRSLHHYLVLAAVGIALGLASVVGLTPATFPWHLREATLYIFAATVIGGLLDHRILTSMLAQPEERIGIEP